VTTGQNTTTETDHDPETVEWNIRRFARRIRFRAGIISGEGYSHGHGTSPLGPRVVRGTARRAGPIHRTARLLGKNQRPLSRTRPDRSLTNRVSNVTIKISEAAAELVAQASENEETSERLRAKPQASGGRR
jgi:hypothetical protein